MILNAASPLLEQLKKQQQGDVPTTTDELLSSGNSFDATVSELTSKAGFLTLDVMKWGSVVITIMFVLGVLMMLLSILFRNGQWQKWGQGTMLISFVALLCIRGIPIVILSFRSSTDIDFALSGALYALTQVAIFLCVVGIILSYLFRFVYKLIDHPEYHRWSKNVFNVSWVMLFVSLVAPLLFKY